MAYQRVFVSSAMADTSQERAAVARVVAELGATPVWFEEFGGRDADAEEAYLAEVDSSTIYAAILKERYGKRLGSGFSATHSEYLRAYERGKRISVWVAADAPDRDGHLVRFIDDLQVVHTTGQFATADDLAARLGRRLIELAAEALSPWVKLGELVFRAEEIRDSGSEITLVAHVGEEIGRRLEALRNRGWGSPRLRIAYGQQVVDADLEAIARTVRAAGSAETTIQFARAAPARNESLRAGTSGYSPDDLIELGMRSLLLGEPLPQSGGGLFDQLCDPGIDRDDLAEAYQLPEGAAEPVTRLVVSDGLLAHGHAAAITRFSLGPRTQQGRRLLIEWEEPRTYSDIAPRRRQIEGLWRPN
jgi:hypothetical protein